MSGLGLRLGLRVTSDCRQETSRWTLEVLLGGAPGQHPQPAAVHKSWCLASPVADLVVLVLHLPSLAPVGEALCRAQQGTRGAGGGGHGSCRCVAMRSQGQRYNAKNVSEEGEPIGTSAYRLAHLTGTLLPIPTNTHS